MKYSDLFKNGYNPELMTKKAFLSYAIGWNMTAKMCGLANLSTAPTCNEYCKARHENPETICHNCYACAQIKRYKNQRAKLEKATAFITSVELEPSDIPGAISDYELFRFEAFGDLINTLQFKNYVTICNATPGTSFALWTKNPFIIDKAFKEYGIEKPSNLIIVLSSIMINKEAVNNWWFVDKVFTVYTKDFVEANGVNINCGANSCMGCRKCYTKTDGVEYIAEMLKSDQRKK